MNSMTQFNPKSFQRWRHLCVHLVVVLFSAIGFHGVTAPIHALTWTPDGKAVLLDQGGSVLIWHLSDATDNCEPWITTNWKTINSIEISPDGERIALGGGVSGEKGEVRIFNLESRQLVDRNNTFSDIVTTTAWTSDSQRLAIGSYDHSIVILERQPSRSTPSNVQFTPTTTLSGHSRAVLDLCFSSDNQNLISCGSDRSIKIWNIETGEPVRSLSNHTDRVLALSSRPTQYFNDTLLPFTCASASDDQTVRIWQPIIGRMVRIVRDHNASVLQVDWDQSGQSVYSADTSGVIRKINGNSDQILTVIETGLDWIHALSVSPDGTALAAGDWNGNVQIWKISSEVNQLTLTQSLSASKFERNE